MNGQFIVFLLILTSDRISTLPASPYIYSSIAQPCGDILLASPVEIYSLHRQSKAMMRKPKVITEKLISVACLGINGTGKRSDSCAQMNRYYLEDARPSK
jgi:hypothetical protein